MTSYKNKEFVPADAPHVEDPYNIKLRISNLIQVNAEIHDTAGQENFEDIRHLTLLGANVIIVCYATDNMVSLDNVGNYWLSQIRRTDSETPKPPPYVLVGTKSDAFNADDPDGVSSKEGRDFAKLNTAADHIRCSSLEYGQSGGTAKKGNIEEVFRRAVVAALKETEYKDRIFMKKKCCCLM